MKKEMMLPVSIFGGGIMAAAGIVVFVFTNFTTKAESEKDSNWNKEAISEIKADQKEIKEDVKEIKKMIYDRRH